MLVVEVKGDFPIGGTRIVELNGVPRSVTRCDESLLIDGEMRPIIYLNIEDDRHCFICANPRTPRLVYKDEGVRVRMRD
jgi:hypothetical protein